MDILQRNEYRKWQFEKWLHHKNAIAIQLCIILNVAYTPAFTRETDPM